VSHRSTHAFAEFARPALRSSAGWPLAASLVGAVLLAVLPAFQTTSPVHVHTTPVAAGSWLNRLNLWRTNAAVTNLTENALWSAGDYNHSVYMVKNDLVTHYETPGVPYYTVEGDTAAQNSNLEVNSTTSFADDQAIDWWMAAPFHAMGMMDPRLTQTGFGSYREVKSGWQAGFSLDDIRGNSFTGGKYPVYFPGNGTTEPLTSYGGGEFPDPLQACPGYSAPTGLPVFIEVGGNVSTTAGPIHSFTGNGVPLAHCVIDSTNSAVSSYLVARGGVIVVPQQPLQAGVRYTVALTVNGVPYTWSFTIGPLAVVPPPAGWQSLGGVISSGPDASSWGPSRTDIFVRGSEGGLWDATWNGASWTWTFLGGVINADPGAVSWGPNRIDVFVRGIDNALWHRSSDGVTWAPWEKLGGVITSGPDAVSTGVGLLDVFVRGTEGGIWRVSWNGTTWSWTFVGGVITSDPGAVASGSNRIDVFVRGTEGGLWDATWNGAAWSWTFLGGVLASGPDAASCTAGHVDVFLLGTDMGLWHRGFTGSTWGPWQFIGGQWSSDPGAVCPTGTTNVSVFEQGVDYAIWTGPAAGS